MGRRHRLKIPSAMDWHWVWFLYLLWAWISSYIKWKYKSICTAKNNKIKWELLKCWPYLYTTQLVRPKLRWRDMSIDMSILSHQIVCVCVLVTQSCPTLYNSMGNARHGISQTRTLEWLAISFSRGSSWPRGWNHHLLCCTGSPTLQADSLPTEPPGKPVIKCTINAMGLNHPKTIPTPQSMEKLSFTKLVPGAKKVGDHCSRPQPNKMTGLAGGTLNPEIPFSKRRPGWEPRGQALAWATTSASGSPRPVVASVLHRRKERPFPPGLGCRHCPYFLAGNKFPNIFLFLPLTFNLECISRETLLCLLLIHTHWAHQNQNYLVITAGFTGCPLGSVKISVLQKQEVSTEG